MGGLGRGRLLGGFGLGGGSLGFVLVWGVDWGVGEGDWGRTFVVHGGLVLLDVNNV